MKTIAFASKKGGVSKTTSAIMTGLMLAGSSRVLLIDLDSQNAMSSFFFDDIAKIQGKTVLEAIRGERTISDLAMKHQLHPNRITQWKRQAIENLAKAFDDKASDAQASREAEVTKLHAKIGQLVVERDFLAKAFDR